jgi:predicted DNA-binding protein
MRGMTALYFSSMKTAISVPDALFERVDAAAAELGLTRSGFFAVAAERWLDELAAEDVTAAIDRALEGVDQEADMEFIREAGRRLFSSIEWEE